jgi:hypothetical protein
MGTPTVAQHQATRALGQPPSSSRCEPFGLFGAELATTPVVWHGTFMDRAGRRHQVDACAGHAHDLDGRRPSS